MLDSTAPVDEDGTVPDPTDSSDSNESTDSNDSANSTNSTSRTSGGQPPSSGHRPDAVASIGEAVSSWFRPVVDPAQWEPTASLVLAVVSAPLLFAAVITAGAVTFGLLFALIGIWLVVPTFRLVDALTAVNVSIAAMAGVTIELRPTEPLDRVGPRRAWRALRDDTRWRRVGDLLAATFYTPVIAALGLAPLALAAQLLVGWTLLPLAPDARAGVGSATEVFALAVAVAAVGAGVRSARWAARLNAAVHGWFISPDRLAAAVSRAEEAAEQRDAVLDAVSAERRRIERNLHDGVQQQLVAIGLDLGMAAAELRRASGTELRCAGGTEPGAGSEATVAAAELVERARRQVTGSVGELRQLGRGLHPAVLADGGLDAALSAVVAAAPLPVSVHLDSELRVSTDVAEVIYFVANESIANVAKHADARAASIRVSAALGMATIRVDDDGKGGAAIGAGSGLAGLQARVLARGGRFTVESPAGGPTRITAEIPV